MEANRTMRAFVPTHYGGYTGTSH